MRRKEREVKELDKILEIMEKCDCCRIGLMDEFGAYIVPMSFGYESVDGKITLYFHGAKAGKKTDLISKQRDVSFEMDCSHGLLEGEKACAYSYYYQSIMGRGKISLVNEGQEKIHGMEKVLEHYAKDRQFNLEEKMLTAVNIIKIEVQELSCKQHVK